MTAPSALATQNVTDTGIAAAFTAADVNGHVVDRRSVLVVKNGSGSPINVTLVTPGTLHGLAIADRVVAVAASAEVYINCTKSGYADPSDGGVHVTFSSVTTVTVASLVLA